MPIISQFYGIVVSMFFKEENKNLPCLYIMYDQYSCVYDLSGKRIEGRLPTIQAKLVEAWIILHTIQLNTLSICMKNGDSSFTIEPLK